MTESRMRREDRGWGAVTIRVPLGLAILLLATAVSCRPKSPIRPTSLLLISIDTLRADHVHAYGYRRETTPHIDALARSGVRATDAWAHSPWTLPSHATLLSGTHPFRHGVVEDGLMIDRAVPMVAPLLKNAGYRTSAVVSGFYVSSRFGFQRGFDTFDDFDLPKGLRKRDSVRAEEVTNAAVRRLEEASGRPFFLFAHYFDAHNDYDAPEPWNRMFDQDARAIPYVNYEYYKSHRLEGPELEHVIAQYDEEIRYVDEMIGRLLGALDAAGRAEDTLVVLTADHGEELFEHGSWGHGNSLYAQVLRVPLIFKGPGVPPGRTLEDFVRHEDLAPTMFDLLHQPLASGFQGRSYASRVMARSAPAGNPSTRRGAPEAGRPLLTETSRFQTNLIGLVDGSMALILDLAKGGSELFDLASDPDETAPLSLASRERDEAGLMDSLVTETLASDPDRWVVAWDRGVSGCARVSGLLLEGGVNGQGTISRDRASDGANRPPAGGERDPSVSLSRTAAIPRNTIHFPPAGGNVRFATVPPDAPVEFFVARGTKDGGCGWDARGSRRSGSERAGSFYSLDPVGQGGRLRESAPMVLEAVSGETTTKGTGKSESAAAGALGVPKGLRVHIESTRGAAVPTNLTPEERERLRSLGYLQ